MYCYAIKAKGQNLLFLMIKWSYFYFYYILEFLSDSLDQFLCHLKLYMCIFTHTAIVLCSIHNLLPYLS